MQHEQSSMHPYGDNFIPVIPVAQETDIRHTPASPFCFDDTNCPCHEDPTLIHAVYEQIQQGLLTPDEATRTVKGEML